MNNSILVLDVDGVLIEGFPRQRWDANLLADLGIRPKELQRKFFRPHWRDILAGRVPVEEPLTAFLESTDSDISTEDFLAYWHGNDAALREDVLQAAVSWKLATGGKTAIATNQDRTRARYLHQTLGLDTWFDTAVISCEIGALKPEAGFFEQADGLLERSAGQQVLFIDDLADNVSAANAHGWDAIQAENPDVALAAIQNLF